MFHPFVEVRLKRSHDVFFRYWLDAEANDDPVHRRKGASLGGNELTYPPPPPPPPPRRNARHFSSSEFYILIKMSLKFVPKGPIDNNPALL